MSLSREAITVRPDDFDVSHDLVLRKSLGEFALTAYEMRSAFRRDPFIDMSEIVTVIAILDARETLEFVILHRVDVFHDLAPSSILLHFEPNGLALIGLDPLGADIALVLVAIGLCAFFEDHVAMLTDWRFAL